MKKDLSPIAFDTIDAEKIEAAIIKMLKEELYLPLMTEIGQPKKLLYNSFDDLVDSIKSGQVYFYRGQFKGSFNVKISSALKNIGAKWDAKHGSFSIPYSKLPIDIKLAITQAEDRFNKTLSTIDKKLIELDPDQMVEKLKLEPFFDRAIYKTEMKIKDQLEAIAVSPNLTEHQKAKITEEYTENMNLYIKEWAEKEIISLREKVKVNVNSGVRYENLIKTIKESYGVSQSKAKFLARQETKLLTVQLQKELYLDAGVGEYRWECVTGSPNHPVRHHHKILEGKIFRWDNPPVTVS